MGLAGLFGRVVEMIDVFISETGVWVRKGVDSGKYRAFREIVVDMGWATTVVVGHGYQRVQNFPDLPRRRASGRPGGDQSLVYRSRGDVLGFVSGAYPGIGTDLPGQPRKVARNSFAGTMS